MEVAIILKITQDDLEGSASREIKVCQSVEAAKEFVIKELQKTFELDDEFDTYAKIANVLAEYGIRCRVYGGGVIDTLWWYNNGKAEQFDIIPMNDTEGYYKI